MVYVSTVTKVGRNSNDSFTKPVSLVVDGIGLPTVALCDTGAQTFLLISPSFGRRLQQNLKIKPKTLDQPLQFKDYRQQNAGTATQSLTCTLEIDGRCFPKQEFIITETGYDVFVGFRWMAQHRLLLDCLNRQLIWPDDFSSQAKSSPSTIRPAARLLDSTTDPDVQQDIEYRDKLFAKEDKRYQIMRQDWRQSRKKQVPFTPRTTDLSNEGTPRKTVPLKPTETKPAQSATRGANLSATKYQQEEADDRAVIAALIEQVDNDPRRERWETLPLPDQPIPIERNPVEATVVGAVEPVNWKTHTGHPIPFPDDEDPEHVKLVRSLIPPQLAHLEGFFSRQQAHTLPRSRPGHDVILEEESKPPATGPPRYQTPPQYMPLERETVDKLLAMDFIEPCMEPDAAAVLFVPKPHAAEKRFCIDFRWRNKYLKPRIVNAPNLAGTVYNCRDAKHMTKIDIIQAFHRLRLHPDSKRLTAFRTRLGTFQWKVLPFGLKVGPAWFQKFINSLLHDLLDWITSAYSDDILIYSDNEKEHWNHVEEVIYRLDVAQLQGDIKKSRFNVESVDYLGVILEAGVGIRIDPAKIQAITDWKFEDLVSRSAIRSFLGLCNYVRMFCHHASDAAEPLNRLLKKEARFEMGSEQRKSFETLKRLASTAPVLAFFCPGRPTKIETDASRNATGGVVWQQQEEGEWKPVGYFSKTMTPAERAYPIQDRELLAVVQTIEHYCPELIGQQFFVVTDHQALIYFSSKRSLSTRQVRWADFLSNFDITFQYRPGRENVVADALSRKTVDNPTVKAREAEDRTITLIPPESIETNVSAMEPDRLSGVDLIDLIVKENQHQQLGYQDTRLRVPEMSATGLFLRTALIREAHEPKIFAHQGQNKVIQLLKKEYHWPSMGKDIRRYVNNCHSCRRNKTPHDKTPGLLHSLTIPQEVWQHVVVDGKDMPQDRHEYNYVWVFVDKFSRLIASLPGKKTDTAEILATRYYRFLYRILGMPEVWISDNAGPFISQFMATVNNLTGTKHRHSSAFHPQTQGAVEVTNYELDQRLRFYIDKYQDDWSDHLPALDFAHNASWHSAIKMAPLKVLLGRDVRNPLSLPVTHNAAPARPAQRALELVRRTHDVHSHAIKAARAAQNAQELQANKRRRPVDFGVGDKVFLKKKGFATTAPTTRLSSQWVGPFNIIATRGHSFELDLPPTYKMSNLFHADRLRKASDNPLPQQHQTPPAPEEINGEPEWEVEEVLQSRLTRNKLEYRVRWVGCDPDEKWYPASNFKNAPLALEKFHARRPKAIGPPVRLRDWISCAAEDRDSPDHKDDNKAEKGTQRRRRHT